MTTKHVNLRLTPEQHSSLVNAAARAHRSVNGHLEWLIEQEQAREALTRKEVHHADGDPLNNDPSNLELREQPR